MIVRAPGAADHQAKVDADLVDLVPRFLENQRREVAAMQGALGSGDLDRVRRIAHGISGSGGWYGFPWLTEAAGAVERAVSVRLRAGEGAALGEATPPAGTGDSELAEVIGALAEFLASVRWEAIG